MQLHYLEIVTPSVDATCENYAAVQGVTFSDPNPFLGNARTASMKDGSMVGVRAPMHDSEEPIVRPYFLVDDIAAAVAAADNAGADVALPPMELPNHGQCAIVMQDGIQTGFWQLPAE